LALKYETEYFLNLPAAVINMAQAEQIVLNALQHFFKGFYIASVNPEICVAATKNKALFDAVSGCSLGIPDGVGIVTASKLLGGNIKERVTGIDFMLKLCEMSETSGYSVFLLGAAPDVAQAAAKRLKEIYPKLVIAGTHHGYFKENEETSVAHIICDSGADIVFVGLGSPRQELFIHKWGEITDAKVLMTVGGSFDVISGNLTRAPEIWQRLSVEWLYRALKQPKRAMRLLKLPQFLGLVIRERVVRALFHQS